MSRRLRLSLLALTLLATIIAGNGSALAADGFQTTGGESFTATGPLTFSSTGGNGICTFALRGALVDAWLPVGLDPISTISGGVVSGCSGIVTGGRLLAPIPGNYVSFAGTLPNPTSIAQTLLGLAVTVTTPFGACLYAGNQATTWNVTAGVMASITVARSTLTKVSGAACPLTATVAGTLTPAERIALAVGDNEQARWQWIPPPIVDYGIRAPGTTTTKTLTFKNKSKLRDFTFGAPPASFTRTNFTWDTTRLANNQILLAGDSVSIDVSFAPPVGAPADTEMFTNFILNFSDDLGTVHGPPILLRGRTTP